MLTERQALGMIAAGGLDFPPLEVHVNGLDGSPQSQGADVGLVLEWDGRRHRFAAEYVGTPTPRRIRAAVDQVQRYAAASPDLLPMVLAPYLAPDTLDLLVEEKVSGLDFSGNGAVVVEGEWLVYRTGKRNRFPSSAPIKAIYRGTSSLVGRVLLSRPEFPAFGEVRDEILRRGGEISPSTVSKVLKGMDEDLIVTRAGTIRLMQPDRLLDRLVDGYRGIAVTRRVRGKAREPRSQLCAMLARNAVRLGERVVGRDDARYVLSPTADETLSVYTTSIDRTLEGIPFTEEDRFPNLELIETEAQEVFFDAREEGGCSWWAPLQTYLELARGGKREREVAEQLRPDLLSQRYG